jgi:thymidylate kinase
MPVIGFETPMDGGGKTATAQAVVDAVNEQYGSEVAILATGPNFSMSSGWARERRRVNQGTDVEARFRYFLELNRDCMALARWHAERFAGVAVLDSTVYRTAATHCVLGAAAARAYVIPPELRPDYTFQLEVDESTRIERLMARDGGLVFSSHWDQQLHERQAEVREAYEAFGLPKLDGTLPLSELVDSVKQLVGV